MFIDYLCVFFKGVYSSPLPCLKIRQRKDMVPEHRHSTVSLREEDKVLHGRDGVHTDILHTMGRMLKRGLVRLE